MEYQKFIPEGWKETNDEFNMQELKIAYEQGKIIQGYVKECDENYNLHISLGNQIKGIIPRNELEAINIDEYGFCKPTICKNKVNNFIQFKVKEIYDENRVILSRKSVQEDALNWMKDELVSGMVVNRSNKEYKTLWSFCRNRWWYCGFTAYRRHICFKNQITRGEIFCWTKN